MLLGIKPIGGVRLFCPQCGAQNPETSKFCSKCGASLVIEDAKNSDPEIVRELRDESPGPILPIEGGATNMAPDLIEADEITEWWRRPRSIGWKWAMIAYLFIATAILSFAIGKATMNVGDDARRRLFASEVLASEIGLFACLFLGACIVVTTRPRIGHTWEGRMAWFARFSIWFVCLGVLRALAGIFGALPGALGH